MTGKWDDPQLDAAQFAIDRFLNAKQNVSEQMSEIYQSIRDGSATDEDRKRLKTLREQYIALSKEVEDGDGQTVDRKTSAPLVMGLPGDLSTTAAVAGSSWHRHVRMPPPEHRFDLVNVPPFKRPETKSLAARAPRWRYVLPFCTGVSICVQPRSEHLSRSLARNLRGDRSHANVRARRVFDNR